MEQVTERFFLDKLDDCTSGECAYFDQADGTYDLAMNLAHGTQRWIQATVPVSTSLAMSASSQAYGASSASAIDASLTTFSSQTWTNPWWKATLSSAPTAGFNIESVHVLIAAGQTFDVETSLDGTTWTEHTALPVTASGSGNIIPMLGGVKAKQVRLSRIGSSMPFSIYDVKVYGN